MATAVKSRFDTLFPDFLDLQKCNWIDNPEGLKTVLEDAVYSPDANILLALYELEDATVVLKKLTELAGKKRLYITHQACHEFICNRSVSITRWCKLQAKQLDEFTKQHDVLHNICNKKEYKLFEDHIKGIKTTYEQTIAKHSAFVQKDLQDKRTGTNDPVMEFLRSLPANAIGDPIPDKELPNLAITAFLRNAKLIPPGFHDTPKMGDFLIWQQLIKYAKEKHNIVFITKDVSSDWYCHIGFEKNNEQREGEVTHARHELAVEFANETKGKRFHAITFSSFAKQENLPPELKEEIDFLQAFDVQRKLEHEVMRKKILKAELDRIEYELDDAIGIDDFNVYHNNATLIVKEWIQLLNSMFYYRSIFNFENADSMQRFSGTISRMIATATNFIHTDISNVIPSFKLTTKIIYDIGYVKRHYFPDNPLPPPDTFFGIPM